jgi:hypothetical protein
MFGKFETKVAYRHVRINYPKINRLTEQKEVISMGRWKMHGCPRCNGSLIIDKDEDGWYEQCINCSYRNDLQTYVEQEKKPVLKGAKSSN